MIVEAPFMEELLEKAFVKLLDMHKQVTNMIKLKFIRNRVTLKITNNMQEIMTFEQTDVRHFRFEIAGLLQNKTGYITAEPQ